MSARRTVDDVLRMIETVREAAAAVGLEQLTYGGGTFQGLHLEQSYGTCKLVVTIGEHGGTTELGTARGVAEVLRYLQGMAAVLNTIRYSMTDAGLAPHDSFDYGR